MRTVLILIALAGLVSDASAACRCGCVRGQWKAICQPTDLVEPVCQGFCSDQVRALPAVTPLAGGHPETLPVRPAELGKPTVSTDPRTGLVEDNTNYDVDSRGYALGTAGVPSGTSGLSSGSAGAAGR